MPDPQALKAMAWIQETYCDWLIAHFSDHEFVKIVVFEDTLPLSTYLYTVNCGPYQVYEHTPTIESSPP